MGLEKSVMFTLQAWQALASTGSTAGRCAITTNKEGECISEARIHLRVDKENAMALAIGIIGVYMLLGR